MKRRLLSTLLAGTIMCSTVPTAFAASSEAINAADSLYSLGLFNGTGTDANGKPIYDLDRSPTRAEAVTMLVRLLGKDDAAKNGDWNTPFTDVAAWAKPYVGYAYANKLTSGTSAASFGSSATVTASQYLTFVLRALGYESGTDFQWNKAWELSDKIGLTDGRYQAGTTDFTRGDVAIISKQALSTKRKDSSATLYETFSTDTQPGTTSTNDTKTEILETYNDGMRSIKAGMELCLDGMQYVSDSNESDAYKIAYLVKVFRYDQEYIRKAIGYWNEAITLCGNYSDTQSMKQYLEQLAEIYAQVLTHTVTADNVVEYMGYRTAVQHADLDSKIQKVTDSWVKNAINK